MLSETRGSQAANGPLPKKAMSDESGRLARMRPPSPAVSAKRAKHEVVEEGDEEGSDQQAVDEEDGRANANTPDQVLRDESGASDDASDAESDTFNPICRQRISIGDNGYEECGGQTNGSSQLCHECKQRMKRGFWGF